MVNSAEIDPRVKSKKELSNKNVSYWNDGLNTYEYKELDGNMETDVVVIGGGIAGISVAYQLLKEGKKVVLLESGNIGQGETGQSTAQIVNTLENGYHLIERKHGNELTKLVAESHSFAIDTIEAIVNDHQIDCDFERIDGYLFTTNKETEYILNKEYNACKRAGIKVNITKEKNGIEAENIVSVKFPEQAQFHPIKYINGLANIIKQNGGNIFINSPVVQINSSGITTQKGFKVLAAHIVVATHFPINFPETTNLKSVPFRTYVIAGKIKKGSLSNSLWWEINADISQRSYSHYARIQKNYDEEHDLLICGGEDHESEQADSKVIDHFQLLKDWGRKYFPMLEEIVYKWSGKVRESSDYLALIGRNPFDSGNIYMITGDSGNGMTYGTIAGLLIKDLIKGKENPWEEVYDPARNRQENPAYFKGQLIDTFQQYIKTLESGNIESHSWLKNGEQIIINSEKNKVIFYKDAADEVLVVNQFLD